MIVPGASLHAELAIYVESGLTAEEAIELIHSLPGLAVIAHLLDRAAAEVTVLTPGKWLEQDNERAP